MMQVYRDTRTGKQVIRFSHEHHREEKSLGVKLSHKDRKTQIQRARKMRKHGMGPKAPKILGVTS